MSPENSHSERSTLKYHKIQLCLGTGPLKRKLKLEEVTRDCLCAQREDHMRSCGETAIYKSRRETFDLELDHGLVASKSMRKHISVLLATWWAVLYCGSSSTGPKCFFFTGGHLLFYSIPERKVSYYSETRDCCSSNNYVRLFSIMIDDFCGTRYWKRSTDTFSYGLVLTREDFHIARGQESCSDSHKIIFSFNSLCTTIIYYFRRMRSKEADQK